MLVYDILKQNKGKDKMILIFIAIIAIIAVAASRSVSSTYRETVAMHQREVTERREAEEKKKKEEKEARERLFPYGEDPMGRYLSYLDRDSRTGAKDFLDSIPLEKTHSRKKVGNHFYDTVSWVETGEDRIKNGGRTI